MAFNAEEQVPVFSTSFLVSLLAFVFQACLNVKIQVWGVEMFLWKNSRDRSRKTM